MSDINGRLTEEVGLFLYQDWGRRLDADTKSRVDFAFWAGKGWILHKVEVGFCILDEKSWILYKIR